MATTVDAAFGADLPGSKGIARLNSGPIPTNRAHRMQPREGNPRDCLCRARAFDRA